MNEHLQAEATVIGAGVAGCCAAIALRRAGVDVLLLEKSSRRPHRFCGEFVSGEAATSLREIGLYKEVMSRCPTRVRRMSLYGRGERPYSLPLAEEGLGLSRRTMDSVLLAQAVKLGARVSEGAFVESVSPASGSGYEVRVSRESARQRAVIRSRVVIGAQGKRSNLDRALGRKFLVESSPYVGVKCHFAGMDRADNVELYLFPGGYCGVVGIEADRTNICLLATERALRQNGGRPEKLIGAGPAREPILGRVHARRFGFRRQFVDDRTSSLHSQRASCQRGLYGRRQRRRDGSFSGCRRGRRDTIRGGLCRPGLSGDERQTNPAVGPAQVRTVGGAGITTPARSGDTWPRACCATRRWARLELNY